MSEILSWIDDLWGLRTDINQVGEQAVAKAQEEARKAKHVAQQIQKDKAINQNFAKFLWFLIEKIEDEALVTELYNTFYKTINPDTQVVYLRKDTNIKVMVWFFVPFFQKEAQSYGIMPAYQKLLPSSIKTLKTYVEYLEKLSSIYHDDIPLHQTAFINLILRITQRYLSDEKENHLTQKDILQALGS